MTNQFLAVIAGLIAVFLALWSYYIGKDKEIREKKKEAQDEIESGIKNNDASSVTSGFDDINRL